MQKLVIITGPTASGKTKYSIEYALGNILPCNNSTQIQPSALDIKLALVEEDQGKLERSGAKRTSSYVTPPSNNLTQILPTKVEFYGEIINADSQQVYIETPILSAQPSEEEKRGVPHHLFAYKHLDELYSVGDWLRDVMIKVEEIHKRGNVPIIVGGSVMYIESLINGISEIPKIDKSYVVHAKDELNQLGFDNLYNKLKKVDPEYAEVIAINDHQRLIRSWSVYLATGKPISYFHSLPKKTFLDNYDVEKILITREREEIYQRINTRFVEMWNEGAVEEARKVMELGYSEDYTNKAQGLIQIIKFLQGEYTEGQAITESQQIIRNYAKRQMTWFRNRMKDFVVRKAV